MARTEPPSNTPRPQGDGAGPSGGGNRALVLLLGGITVLALAGIAIFAVFNTAGDSETSGARGFTPNDEGLIPVGERAPEIVAPTVSGGEVSVGEGQSPPATMLVFFATWCPHCQNEAPVISELESQYDDLQVVMIGIDEEDDARKVERFVENYGIESPAVYEPRLGRSFGVSGYPTVYVLREGEVVVGAHAGEAPRGVLEGWIEEAM